MPGPRVRELIEALGYVDGKTIVDDYLREIRPVFAPPRTSQCTVYRPGESCQFDLWEPKREIPYVRMRSPPATTGGLSERQIYLTPSARSCERDWTSCARWFASTNRGGSAGPATLSARICP
jgi:hypothetical protein